MLFLLSLYQHVLCPYRDAKAHCSTKNLADQIPNLGALRSVKCNANGSQVSILISQVSVL